MPSSGSRSARTRAMSSSDFAPLAEGGPKVFRPFEPADFRARSKERYERELLELALGVARQVVQQALARRPDVWLGIAIRVPPHQLAFLRGSLAQLRASLADVKDLELV